MRASYAVAALFVAIAGAASGCRCDREQPKPAPPLEPLAVRKPKPVALGPYHVRAKVPSIAYAVVTRDRVVATDASGRLTRFPHDGALPTTIFEAASIAKTIIGVSVMQLVEQKKLDLDVDVSNYVGFRVANPSKAGPITLRHLLSHRSSIVDHIDELQTPRDKATLAEALQRYLVQNGTPRADAYASIAPGAKVVYSNVGSALAALAVERASGEGFAEYTVLHVFTPLKMASTQWTGETSLSIANPNRFEVGRFVELPQASHAIYPVVDLRSTALDLARFARAILRDGELDDARILEAKSVATMLAPADDAKEEALGWQLRKIAGRRVSGHEGEDAGASTGMYLDKTANVAAIVLTNGDAFASGDEARSKAIQDLFAELFELVPSPDAN